MDLRTIRNIQRNRRVSGRKLLAKQLSAIDPALGQQIQNLQIPWFAIEQKSLTNQSTEDTTDVYIYQEIDWFWGISADDFIQELNEVTTPNINLRLNSPGGEVFDAIAIYNALVSHPANVTVYVDSLAASAASLIAMCGDKIVMMVGSQMMIHDAMGVSIGNAAELRDYADWMDKQSDNIASIYARRAGGEASEWRDRMIAETWLFADEAVEIGLADEVFSKPSNADNEDPDKTDEPDPADPNEPDEGEEDDSPMPMPEEEDTEDSIQDLMKVRHSLTNRGWKHAGRFRAPSPITDMITDSMLDSFVNALRK